MNVQDLKLDPSDHGAGQTILCPICGFAYNHGFDENGMASIFFFDGKDGYKAGWGGRGQLVIIQMTCEAEHQWEMCIGFHKGAMYTFARQGHSKRELQVPDNGV